MRGGIYVYKLPLGVILQQDCDHHVFFEKLNFWIKKTSTTSTIEHINNLIPKQACPFILEFSAGLCVKI